MNSPPCMIADAPQSIALTEACRVEADTARSIGVSTHITGSIFYNSFDFSPDAAILLHIGTRVQMALGWAAWLTANLCCLPSCKELVARSRPGLGAAAVLYR